jgi:hypothetical protein
MYAVTSVHQFWCSENVYVKGGKKARFGHNIIAEKGKEILCI